MKAIIEIRDDENLSGIHFTEGRKIIEWGKLTQEQQDKILDAWKSYYLLFSKFRKGDE